ncbi:reverse transcriptase N-terminal domain-containing protein, partial [Pseudomonas aeruginosa]|nr:reverse transcriptase N-terminal domain-containing protein [Pseudomonas aeruginosa]
ATSCAVSRMQARIAKAAKDKQWRRVTRLQKLLVRSTAAKATAVRRVTENQGRRTPGVDRATWSTPAAKWNAINSLQRKGYKAKPLRRIHIPKARGGTRPLGIPTMKDRAMQALYLFALDPVAEAYGDIHSYGFRSFRSTADAAAHLKTCLSTKTSSRWVMEGDIKGCFDNISHDWLMKHVPIDRHVLSQWLKAGFMEDRKLFPTDAGTPQGGIISP